MGYQLLQLARQQPFASGVFMPGARLRAYLTGTSTATPVYSDSALTTPVTQPVVADATGTFIALYIDPAITYKITLSTSADALVYTDDPANDSTVLTQSLIGEILYPRTAAEISAGVTPTNYYRKPGDVRRYGAAVDGSTSDHTAFQSADSQALNGGSPIFIPRTPSGMATNTALTVNALSDVEFEPGAKIIYTGSSNITVLTIGAAASNQVCFSRRYENLWVERQNQSDWSNTANIGIRVYNAAGCYFSISQLNGHTIGFQALPSNGAGFQGNELHFGHVYNCKYARDWSNASSGFCNDNTIYAGRIQAFSAVDALGTRYGDRVTSSDAAYVDNNGNRFYGALIELNAAGTASEAVAILVEYGEENFWHNIRSEGNDLTMRCANASQRNEVWLGYSDDSTATLEQTGTASQNIVVAMRDRPRTHYSYALAYFPDLGRYARGTSGTSIQIEGLTWGHSSFAAIGAVSSTTVTYDGNYVTIPVGRAMGLYVDTSTIKEFVVRRNGTAGGRVRVIAYDSGSAVLSAAGTVLGTDAAAFSYSAGSFGGSWGTGSDSLSDQYFRVSSSTAYVWVGVAGGDADAVLSGFGVYAKTSTAGVRSFTNMYTSPGEIIPTYTTGAHATLRDFTGTTTAAQALQLLESLVDDLKTLRILR